MRAHLSLTGATLVDVTRIPHLAGHWIVRLPLGTASEATADLRARLRADDRFTFTSVAHRRVGSTDPTFFLNRVTVPFRDGTSRLEVDSIAGALDMTVIAAPDPARGRPWFQFEYSRRTERDLFAQSSTLDSSRHVVWAAPDRLERLDLASVPTDPYYGSQFHLKNALLKNGVPVDIDVERVWDYTKGYGAGGSMIIAVVDDGIESAHPDLSNTFPGFDAMGTCGTCPNDVQRDPSHGQGVVGIMAATHSNGVGVSGVAPEASYYPVRIADNNPFGWYGSPAQIASGINWAAMLLGAPILNNSWGFVFGSAGNYPEVETAINNAAVNGRGGKGTVLVFAAGNPSRRNIGKIQGVLYPATNANVIAVSAIDRHGDASNYAPRGSAIALVAPSSPGPVVEGLGWCQPGSQEDVLSLDLSGSRGCNDGPTLDLTGTFGGTSAAAPQVSGVVALLLSREPSLSLTQVRARLTAGADPWGLSTDFGAGKLNALFTVFPLAASVSGPAAITSPGNYTWTTNVTGGDAQYSYAWHYRNLGTVNWVHLGPGPAVTRNIQPSTMSFSLRVTVTSQWRSVQALKSVSNDQSQCTPYC